MIYGFSMLFLLLCLVTGFPALRRLLHMYRIKRDCATTTGEVISRQSALGWLWTAQFGSITRPQIRYFAPDGRELNLEVLTSSMFTFHRYEPGASELVVYRKDRPGQAYAASEWGSALRDVWLSVGSLVIAIFLWVLGRALGFSL